ncbi:voltage-dependent T-type calcium channel subunit alpha-1H-like [Odontesthes bonariensis]|uniref:voltage-dependent T-type calcium channel subunit alpha-1H-like n=1 Tax=Odontesthes bonariensis TaxID=219752 RepID=UPI003F58E7C5
MLDYIVSAFGVNFGVGHALRPIRLISRIQSFRDLVSILLDSVPMLGNVLIVYLFVIHIFAVIGVQLWGGELRNRCFLGEDILTTYWDVLGSGRLVHHFPYLKRQLMVLYRSIEEASTLCWLMLFYIFIFGVVGMYLFGCKFVYISPDGDPADDRKNFDSLLWSMVTVFQILTLEDWNLVLFNAMASTSAWAALCFIALIVIGKNVLLNVIVGIVVRNFQSLARLIRRVLPWCKEREDWTFYLVPPENKFRTFCKKLTDDTRFDIGILLVILLCCFTIAFERPGISPNSTERWILDSVCHSGTFVFTVEMFLKVMANGLIFGEGSYIKCSWNILDGSLVITSLVNICITVVTSGKAKRLSTLKVIRLLRALRPLRMIKKTSRLKLAVEALMASVKPVANILLICGVFFFFFYGTLGVQLFKGKFFHCVGEDVTDIVSKSECLAADYHWVQKNYNFDNILQALMSLFVMYSKNGWVNLMYDGLDAVAVDIQPVRNYNELALAYFVVFVSFFLLDMFISIIAETFCQCQQMQQLEVEESGRQVHSLPSNQQELEPFYVNYSTVRRFIYKVCSTRAFDLFVPALIIINVGIMSFEHYGQPQYLTQISDYSFYVFTLLLIGEMVLKLIAFGPVTFLKNR